LGGADVRRSSLNPGTVRVRSGRRPGAVASRVRPATGALPPRIRPSVVVLTSRRASPSEPQQGAWAVVAAVFGTLACAIVLRIVIGAR